MLDRPVRIIDQKWDKEVVPLVSICCVAFNHGPYIRESIEGFLMQETTFPVEILIHDDASTDNTAEVIRDYEARYPHLIKAIYQTENQYSRGHKPYPSFVLPRARGKYIATCEGDDYWVDPRQLQIQAEFLDRNPQFVMCHHDAEIIDEDGNTVAKSKLPDSLKRDISGEELMLGEWTLTLTRMFRNVLDEYPEEAFRALNGDIFLTVQLGAHGSAKYLGAIRNAVYRVHCGSIWSSLPKEIKNLEQLNSRILMYQYHLRATGQQFAVRFLFHSVVPQLRTIRPSLAYRIGSAALRKVMLPILARTRVTGGPMERTQASLPKWARMTRNQKIVYVAKVAICILTFGFVFPDIRNT
jgi:glycosyltransferase involved in cell wall biosynthesis